MLSYIEQELTNLKTNMLIIETSSDDAQKVRDFYMNKRVIQKNQLLGNFGMKMKIKLFIEKN